MNEKLIAIEASHSIYIERFAASQGNKVLPYIQRINEGILAILNRYDGLNITPKRRLRIEKQISELVLEELRGYIKEYRQDNREFGIYEAEFQKEAIEKTTAVTALESATASLIAKNVVETPIQLGENSWTEYNRMLASYPRTQQAKINALVESAFLRGLTYEQTAQIIRDEVLGSKTGKGSSALDMSYKEARTVAQLGVNHVATSANLALLEENADIVKGVRLIATLDSLTSKICRSIDNTVVLTTDKNFKSKQPPFHRRCRTKSVLELYDKYDDDNQGERASAFTVDGKRDPKPVDSKKTYYEQLSKLSASDQDAVLGKQLGRAFRKMNNPTEFAKYTTKFIDGQYKSYTLTELKKQSNALARILNDD